VLAGAEVVGEEENADRRRRLGVLLETQNRVPVDAMPSSQSALAPRTSGSSGLRRASDVFGQMVLRDKKETNEHRMMI
jgi:hypothetical protein